MTTSISPSLGHGALFTQQGIGTTPGYDAIDLRRATTADLQEGVVAGTDYMVTQRASGGAAMFVDITAGGTAQAFVQGDTVSGQGLYAVPPHSASVITEAVTAANASNPRIDSVILEIQDNVHDSSGGNLARIRVLTGTATSGATLSNRTGAAALPSNALLLADLLVPALGTTVTNANIRDRRKWARGAHVKVALTSGNVTTNSVPMVAIAAALQARIECSGVPLRVRLLANGSNGTATDGAATGFTVDGALADSAQILGMMHSSAANLNSFVGFDYETTPAAGSHVISPTVQVVAGGSLTIQATAGIPCVLVVEEIVRQNLVNNSVTTG